MYKMDSLLEINPIEVVLLFSQNTELLIKIEENTILGSVTRHTHFDNC